MRASGKRPDYRGGRTAVNGFRQKGKFACLIGNSVAKLWRGFLRTRMGDPMIRNLALGLMATASTLVFAAPALADTPAAQTAAAQQVAPVATVIVTANKREELLRNVAQSVTAVSQRSVEQLQDFNFADSAKLVPGLSVVEAT